MARKLRCTVTGNWSYCSEERYQKLVEKFGGEAELTAKYVSREGKKVTESGGTAPDAFKNKIRCTLTGELCYISDERMKKLAHKAGSQQKVRDTYVSRVAKRLLKEGKTEAEIKPMAAAGTLPSAAEIKADGDAGATAGKKAAKGGAKKAVAKKGAAKGKGKVAKKKTAKKAVANPPAPEAPATTEPVTPAPEATEPTAPATN